MFKLLRFLKEYKKESILGPLFKLLEASFELIIPIIMACIIDIGIANKDNNVISRYDFSMDQVNELINFSHETDAGLIFKFIDMVIFKYYNFL